MSGRTVCVGVLVDFDHFFDIGIFDQHPVEGLLVKLVLLLGVENVVYDTVEHGFLYDVAAHAE